MANWAAWAGVFTGLASLAILAYVTVHDRRMAKATLHAYKTQDLLADVIGHMASMMMRMNERGEGQARLKSSLALLDVHERLSKGLQELPPGPYRDFIARLRTAVANKEPIDGFRDELDHWAQVWPDMQSPPANDAHE